MAATVYDSQGGLVTPSEFLTWLLGTEHPGGMACDTETDGLAWEAQVRLVQFGDTEGGYAIDVTDEAGVALAREAVLSYQGTLTFHNAPFDIHRLDQLGIDPDYLWPRAENTHVLHHIIDPSANHGLKDIGAAYFGPEVREPEKAMKALAKSLKVKWWELPTIALAEYGVQDTVLTERLAVHLRQHLSGVEWKVAAREMEAAQAVAEVSNKGILLDIPYAEELAERWRGDIAADLEWFAERGITNPNANRQIAASLIESEWVPEKFTPSKEVCLDKTVLAQAAQDGFNVAQRLIAYKRRVKWLSAYVENSLAEADSDGRVHASYNSLGARTGRMSCSNPPLQQLPKGGGGEVRRMFIAKPGHLITSVDYAQIEMRLAAHFAHDEEMMYQFATGIDVYQKMADRILCTRPQAKIASLAALYGSRGKSIALALGVTPSEAVGIVQQFWREYPDLNKWAMGVTAAAKGGRNVTSRWGRTLSPHMPYAAGNAIIQGTAAEVMKDGILRLAEHNLLQYVVAIVHDEVVMECPEDEAQAITDHVVQLLEDHSFDVLLAAEGTVYGHSWGDGYATKEVTA